MKPEWQILGWALTAVVALVGYKATRRSATESTGATLLIAAAERQSKDIETLRTDLTTLKGQVRDHRSWDVQVYDAMRGAGMPVDPPPPLD